MTTTSTDWRRHDTKRARDAFADAQDRLDNLNLGEEGYTAELRAADEQLTAEYNRLVLNPAHDEFEQQCDEAEFARHFPEPPDGSRFEFKHADAVYGAFRFEHGDDDDVDADGRPLRWWLYGSNEPWSWRALVFRYQIDMGNLAHLVEQTEATR